MKGVISPEAVYDSEVSPLVVRLFKLCKESKVPILCCSSFRTKKGDEGSCCSANLGDNSSLRMQHMFPIVANHGMPSHMVFARIMLGEDAGFDDNWYKGVTAAKFAVIEALANQIGTLVNVTHVFPTALIIQTPTPKRYLICGEYPSDKYEGIQYLRVIAEHGYSAKAAKTLCGGNSDDPIVKDVLSVKALIGKAKRK